jgi:glycogen debranching enzyme
MDALWNDDLHHSAMVAMTGYREAYYTDYEGRPQELISAVKWGYLYQGQRYIWQNKRRGKLALDIEPAAFVVFIQNHDQIYSERWAPVVEAVRTRLLTPIGLRSLAPGSPDYKSKYFGDLRARDAAYHQGTVWAWLIGPFIDAWLKVHPDDRSGARHFLDGFVPQLDQACVGSIGEVFDAEAPFTPHGCVAQAWSVAEVLRCWAKTA